MVANEVSTKLLVISDDAFWNFPRLLASSMTSAGHIESTDKKKKI